MQPEYPDTQSQCRYKRHLTYQCGFAMMFVVKYLKLILILPILTVFLTPVAAAPCPDDFDYVDLGVMNDLHQLQHRGIVISVIRPGGIRLIDGVQDCVPYVGDAQPRLDRNDKPIPLIHSLRLSGTTVSDNIEMLDVTAIHDMSSVEMTTQATAAAHFGSIGAGNVDIIAGENFTCATAGVPFAGNITCEILSLSQENTPAVVQCSAILCVLPLALDDSLFVTVRWDAAGESITSPFARGTWIEQVVADVVTSIRSSIER